jgi:hypothetical protein
MKSFFSYHLESISFIVYFIGIIIYAYKVDSGKHYRVLAGYYLFATIAMIVASNLEFNPPVYNLLYLVTSMGVGYYFYCILQGGQKKIAWITTSVTAVYYIVSSLMNGFAQVFDSIGHVIASAGIVLLIFLFLYQVMSNVKEEPISHSFDFWFSTIQLMYHLGSFAIFLSYNYFTHKFFSENNNAKEIGLLVTYLWMLHNVILFLGALITNLGIAWIYRRKSRLS